MSKIYFVQCETGPIKIGWSRTFSDRFRNLQTGCPYALSVLLVLDAPKSAEKRLHRFFDEHCIHHEWFKPAAEIVSFIERAKTDGLPVWVMETNVPQAQDEASQDLAAIVRQCAEPAIPGEKTRDQIARAAKVLDLEFDQVWRCWYGRGGRRLYPLIKSRFALVRARKEASCVS